jgi:hypothetical protein
VAALAQVVLLAGRGAAQESRTGEEAAMTVSPIRLLWGFVAGFLATLVFHQVGLLLCHAIGLTQGLPWNTSPVPPFGAPRVIQLAFWGGVWGIPFVLLEPLLAKTPGGYWVGAILFGIIGPDLASWFVVAPLKGLPLGRGFHFPGLLVGPIVNGLWGLGTGVLLRLAPKPAMRTA